MGSPCCTPSSTHPFIEHWQRYLHYVVQGCSSFHPVAMAKPKATEGRKGLFGLGFQVTVRHREKPRQELKQEIEVKTMCELCLLALSLAHSSLASTHNPNDHLAIVTPANGLALPTLINKTTHHRHVHRPVDLDNS